MIVTAGPTREYLDPVRFISNRSSGKMGYAIAAAARARGHDVVLISGPVSIPAPPAVRLVSVVSAAEMLVAVESHLEASDALIMAAAVSDWRPVVICDQKLKKLNTGPELRLEPTADILMTIKPRKGKRVVVGFAAETFEVEAEARRKLDAKGLDMIVANDVTQADAGFDVDTNRVVLITKTAVPLPLPLMSKREVGERIVEWVEERAGKPGQPAKIDCGLVWEGAGDARLAQQLAFIREIDKLKRVSRRTLLLDGSRFENDAEHSWHLAVMAVLLKEYANVPAMDLARVIKMVLIHDIVEIDAGDTYCYDEKGNVDKLAREKLAATRIFGLLPAEQQAEFHALWEEFEKRLTPEAQFAAALDRVQPLMHNYFTQGVVWRDHGVTRSKVLDRNRHVQDGSRPLWQFAEALIQDAVERGYLEA
ncbi:MAG: phosphopantothenoylcysteine decarboxylase [bacterium]